MDQNPYAAPSLEADGPLANGGSSEVLPWFAVGTRKLWLMSIVTLGLYTIHWFERQYRFQKRARHESMWPLGRAIFSVFYAHELFGRIELAAAPMGIRPSWRRGALGTMFCAAAILGWVLDRVSDKVTTGTMSSIFTLLGLLMVLGLVYPIVQVQGTVNEILDRGAPGHDKNERLTVWNWLVIAAGAVVLGLLIAGLALPDEETLPAGNPTLDF